ncbi:MAG: 3-isopropylmalate dehydratase small subunit, partial [candidate division WOR-3 bacterium]
MAHHAMEGTDRGEEFIKGVSTGDVIVGGSNFGCGSSREHAPVAVKGSGIAVVIAESFARIFHRNCVNTGLPILILENSSVLADGDIVEIDLHSGSISNKTRGEAFQARTLSALEIEIMQAGGLLEYLKHNE